MDKNKHAEVGEMLHIARNKRETMFQSSRGNLSVRSIERQAEALALGFESSPALRDGIRNRQDTARKPLSDFDLKSLLQLLAPLASVKQFAPLANFPSVMTLMKTESSATESTH